MRSGFAVLIGCTVSVFTMTAHANIGADIDTSAIRVNPSPVVEEGRIVSTSFLKDAKTGAVCVLNSDSELALKQPPCSDDQIVFVDSLMENAVYGEVRVASNLGFGSMVAGGISLGLGSVFCSVLNSNHDIGANVLKVAPANSRVAREAANYMSQDGSPTKSWVEATICRPAANALKNFTIYNVKDRVVDAPVVENRPK